MAAAAVAAALVVQDAVSDHVNQEEGCWWSSGVTPAWMCEQIGIGVPAEASDRRAGYRTGERYDVGLLAFTLPTKDADAYLLPSRPEETEMIPNLHPQQKGYLFAQPLESVRTRVYIRSTIEPGVTPPPAVPTK
ncbi:hypothetical protein ACFY8C_39765 [Streptomyces flavochromogenes]|uniref:Uncharacterized protein n=1 Tax=Streptomyces flavochromogenes TaxID=68199 RepID=A0ABW6Y3L3_9ACTN|nr:hypothetical protein [Streptomyces flavochromogenes]